MRVERRRAVRAHDLEVLEPIVRGHAVDVVEDQRHAAPAPPLVLTAELAAPLLEAFGEQALLERPAAVLRPGDEDLLQRARATTRSSRGTGIEVCR
jgi:hypothetical protein